MPISSAQSGEKGSGAADGDAGFAAMDDVSGSAAEGPFGSAAARSVAGEELFDAAGAFVAATGLSGMTRVSGG